MFNPWYTNNETYVGPLTPKNELTMDVKQFLRYAQHMKSSSNSRGRKGRTNLTNEPTETNSEKKSEDKCENTKYVLNEFIVGPTRMQYYDGSHFLGFASTPYTSSVAIQNIERLVIHPDIGYYTRNENTVKIGGGEKQNDTRRKINRYLFESNETRSQENARRNDELAMRNNDQYLHSDFTRKYSPQEALARVLASPLFNGNNTKTILQSSKSERYYQLTFPLENCGRMYVMAAPMLPCYSIIQPWAHVCRLFQINQLSPPSRYVVPIEQCPKWAYLAKTYNVKHAILLPNNISMMNRRDPVIQEGSIEIISVLFTYDTCDADIQFNNPYGCYNKHEDYDGDTNTQSIGKGVESHTEICYNMKRQCLPGLRVKSVIPQNMLSRIMLYFMDEMNGFDDNDRITYDHLASVLQNDTAVRVLRRNRRIYDDLIRKQFAKNEESTNETIPYAIERIFALELFRRTCVCIAHIVIVDGNNNNRNESDKNEINEKKRNGEIAFKRYRRMLNISTRIFKRTTYANIYLYYLSIRTKPVLRKIRRFAEKHLHSRVVENEMFNEKLYDETRDVLHHVHKLWAPVSLNIVTNCQTLIDDVIRTIYCVMGENECTDILDHCSLAVHRDFPNFFLGHSPFDLEYIINVLSRAKGDFDSLLKMHTSLYRRFREETNERHLERSRTKYLQLNHRDLLTRIEPDRLEKYIDYTDKYVLGSKKIPKSCKQANSMKWAMQNVQYYDGDLYMNDELILKDVMRYFSMEFFSDRNIVDLVLNNLTNREKVSSSC